MILIPIKIKRMKDDWRPKYRTEQAAGMDLHAAIEAQFWSLAPGERRVVPTGVTMELPDGYEAQVRPRSGLAAKHGITVLNTPGTIDPDYRGEVKVILVNLGAERFQIERGQCIAQLVIAPFARARLEDTEKVSKTQRGSEGFGHTDKE